MHWQAKQLTDGICYTTELMNTRFKVWQRYSNSGIQRGTLSSYPFAYSREARRCGTLLHALIERIGTSPLQSHKIVTRKTLRFSTEDDQECG
jgi:hypothetical protein